MNGKIYGLTESKGQFQLVDIFGYATQGLPGIEVIGVGKSCRAIKEKIIFFTRYYGMRLPLRRYVLCLDSTELLPEKVKYGNLELPFLLILWHLAGLLPIQKLDDCLAFGKLSSDGSICLPNDHKSIKALIQSFCSFSGEEIKIFLEKEDPSWPSPTFSLSEILGRDIILRKFPLPETTGTILPMPKFSN